MEPDEERGRLPESADHRAILADAIRECAANTVKHARGDSLTVEISGGEGSQVIFITNSGEPPAAPIAESGGLLSLRRRIEEQGGRISVQSLPFFSLTIYL